MSSLTPARLRVLAQAACTLFGPHEPVSQGFWTGLDLGRLKRAFREKAKLFHPDARPPASPREARENQRRFAAAKQSYDILKVFIGRRSCPPRPARKPSPACIVAVAGPTGGVGKSVVTANLAVMWARQGRRVMVADLEPQGLTLPLYLGNPRPPCPGPPTMMQGDLGAWRLQVSRFGPAILHFADLDFSDTAAGQRWRRLLLLNLRRMPADVILCDLGSGAAPGLVDLFLGAHRHVLVTTLEPAALVRTMDFLKLAHSRKERSHLESDAACQGQSGALSAAQALSPFLLVNQVCGQEVHRVRRQVEEAAAILGLTLEYGLLPHREEIAQSVRDLVPAVARHPLSPLARHFAHLGRRLAVRRPSPPKAAHLGKE